MKKFKIVWFACALVILLVGSDSQAGSGKVPPDIQTIEVIRSKAQEAKEQQSSERNGYEEMQDDENSAYKEYLISLQYLEEIEEAMLKAWFWGNGMGDHLVMLLIIL